MKHKMPGQCDNYLFFSSRMCVPTTPAIIIHWFNWAQTTSLLHMTQWQIHRKTGRICTGGRNRSSPPPLFLYSLLFSSLSLFAQACISFPSSSHCLSSILTLTHTSSCDLSLTYCVLAGTGCTASQWSQVFPLWSPFSVHLTIWMSTTTRLLYWNTRITSWTSGQSSLALFILFMFAPCRKVSRLWSRWSSRDHLFRSSCCRNSQ